ncbi:MAG: hypothetical protein ACRD63_00550, partial [Pyrinomonadaceae bacterium]
MLMQRPQRRSLLAGIISTSLVFASLIVPAQQTRPRRVNKESAIESIAPPITTIKRPAIKREERSELKPSQTEVVRASAGTMPEIRIGLATSARTASISAQGQQGQLLATVGLNRTPEPLPVSDVRVEPRNYSPPTKIDSAGSYLVKLSSEFQSRKVAENAAREIRNATGVK